MVVKDYRDRYGSETNKSNKDNSDTESRDLDMDLLCNVLDGLSLQRSSDLPAYRVLSIENTSVGGTQFTRLNFAFVDSDANPFVQRIPVVVRGMDILIRDGDRVIVATYMAEEAVFDENLPSFQRFLNSLRY